MWKMNSKRPRKNTENQNSWCMVKVVWGFPGGSNSKESAFSAGVTGSILRWGRSLVKGMATHSSILAWKIPWTEEPDWLQSMKSQRFGHNKKLALSLSEVVKMRNDDGYLE